MSAAIQAQARALFDRARPLNDASRRALLDNECPDPAVRAEVEALLAASDDVGDVIDARVRRAAREALAARAMPAELGPYRLVAAIGEGGMGMVWRAERADGEFVKSVAIKVIRGVPSVHAIERLRRERQVLADLDHPGIARLIDGGTLDSGEPYLVMDYVEGEPLGEWLARKRPGVRERVALFVRLCEAVQFAHQRLIVHCDLKPANVMVRPDDTPVLLDFGIARLLEPGEGKARTATFAVTPAYASPEQLLGQPVTLATDVFGLGMVLYEMLAGVVPERGADAVALSRELPTPSQTLITRGDTLIATQLHGDLDSIVRMAVRVEPNRRYASATDLARDAQAWLDGRPVQAAGGHWRYLVGKFARRHRVGVTLAGLALVAMTALGALAFAQYREALRASERAEREALAARATADFLRDLYTELDPSLHAGRVVDARELLDLGRARLDKLADTAPATRAALETSLAEIYLEIGKPSAALELATAAVGRLDRARDNPRTIVEADALLARAHNAALDFAQGRVVGDRALAAAQALGDPALEAPIRTARAWSALALGDVAAARRDYDWAEAYFKTQGEAGLEPLGRIAYNRAQLAEGEGQLREALRLYQESFAINEKQQGRDQPITLLSQFGMGKIEIMLGHAREARERLSDLLTRSRRVHGPDTMASERAVAELANAQREFGEPEAARASFAEALRITRIVNGDKDTQQLATHLSNLGMVEEHVGHIDEALRLQRQALQARVTMLGADATPVASSQVFIARVLTLAGRFDEAEPAAREAVRIRALKLAPDHEQLLAARALLTEILASAGRVNEAPLDSAAIASALARDPPPPVRVVMQLLQADAALAQARGDATMRATILERELALMRETQNDQHPLQGWIGLRLAEALADAGQTARAREAFTRAEHIVVTTHDPASPARAIASRLRARLF